MQSSYSWRYNRAEDDAEKEQRRKFRVERKLQELEELQDNKENIDDTYHDIVEFAQNYFNSHERSPDGKEIIVSYFSINHYLNSCLEITFCIPWIYA